MASVMIVVVTVHILHLSGSMRGRSPLCHSTVGRGLGFSVSMQPDEVAVQHVECERIIFFAGSVFLGLAFDKLCFGA